MAAAEPPIRLHPTFNPTHTRARSWRKPGGPWDGASLQSLEPAGSHLAVVSGETRLSASEFSGIVAEMTARLRDAGIRRDDVVAWQLPNSPRALALFWACWRIGAIAAPVHRRLGAAEVTGALDQVSPALVFAAADLPASDLDVAVRVVLSAGALELPAIPQVGLQRRARGDPYAGSPVAASVRGSHLAAVLFTSGSSGVPKAVLHSHRALAYKATLMAGVHGLRPGDPVLAPAPLAHVSGLLNGVLISAAVRWAVRSPRPLGPGGRTRPARVREDRLRRGPADLLFADGRVSPVLP